MFIYFYLFCSFSSSFIWSIQINEWCERKTGCETYTRFSIDRNKIFTLVKMLFCLCLYTSTMEFTLPSMHNTQNIYRLNVVRGVTWAWDAIDSYKNRGNSKFIQIAAIVLFIREPNVWHTCGRVSNEIEKKNNTVRIAFIDHTILYSVVWEGCLDSLTCAWTAVSMASKRTALNETLTFH